MSRLHTYDNTVIKFSACSSCMLYILLCRLQQIPGKHLKKMRHRLNLRVEGQILMHQDLDSFVEQNTITKGDQPVATEEEVPDILALKQSQENHHTKVSQNHFKGLQEGEEESNIMIDLKPQIKQQLLAQWLVLDSQWRQKIVHIIFIA